MAIIDILLGIIIPRTVIGQMLNIDETHHQHTFHQHNLSSQGDDHDIVSNMILLDDKPNQKSQKKSIENSFDGSNSVKKLKDR